MTTNDRAEIERLHSELTQQRAVNRTLAMALRQAALMVVNEIEVQLAIEPRTSQLRRIAKGKQPERS